MQAGRWFQSLPDDVRQEIDRLIKVRRFRAGTAVFREGDPPSGLHRLQAGTIHITGCAHDGTEVLMAILQPGDWTGFLANLDGEVHVLTATCDTDCEVATLSRQSVRDIFETSTTRYKLLVLPELIVARRNYRYLVEQNGGPPLQRVAFRLLDLARGPFGQSGDIPTAPICISQEQLGAATLLSRQKVNALLQSLAGCGLIAVSRGAVRIVDPAGLSRIARWER